MCAESLNSPSFKVTTAWVLFCTRYPWWISCAPGPAVSFELANANCLPVRMADVTDSMLLVCTRIGGERECESESKSKSESWRQGSEKEREIERERESVLMGAGVPS